MCGLVAVMSRSGSRPDPDQIERITDRLTHRGPDGRGSDTRDHVGLGHRRLAIIDVDGAQQPMSGPGGVRITFNGEIYNFRVLRRELAELGHTFTLESDTEVLAHAVAEWGVDCLPKLSGMFALVVDDPQRGEVWAARDRMGQKPLFAFDHRVLPGVARGFVSELRAITDEPGAQKTIEPQAVASFLAYDFVPEPGGIFAGAEKVLPGEVWRIDRDRPEAPPRRQRWWELPFGRRTILPANEALEALAKALDEAVAERLVADVPLGIFLSGGIDSSLVTAIACRHTDPARLKTFAIGFDDPAFDERSHAARVAHHLGCDHRERIVSADDLLAVVPEVFAAQDEPFGDPSIIPTTLLARFAREEVTVAIGGDGGDELLLGYPTFVAEEIIRRLSWLPGSVWRGSYAAAALLPAGDGHYPLEYKLKRFLRGASQPLPERHQTWIGGALPEALDALMPHHSDPAERLRASLRLWGDASGDDLARLTHVYAGTYLAAGVLQKVDRASMSCSLEVRAPMLDHRFVTAAAACPNSLRVRGKATKIALRRLAEEQLPKEIVDRPKRGFGIPLARWLKGPLADWSADLLAEGRMQRQGLVDPNTVTRLLDEHRRGRANHAKILWNLCALSAFVEPEGVA
jgi:asparagine synthase (glutamine-hydrolysing)